MQETPNNGKLVLIGTAKVGVFCSKAEGSKEVSRGIVEGLKRTYREQNYKDHDNSSYIPVLLNETELKKISESGSKDFQQLNNLTIHARYSDGEVYCNVRNTQKLNDEKGISDWKEKLSHCKRISLDQLLKREDITELLDHLLSIPGLWTGLELGNIQKNLALRCDEEITRYLGHIRSVWEKVTLSDGKIQRAADVTTVRLLQLRVPFLSRSDGEFVKSEMASGKLFPKIVDPKTRKDILEAILKVDCLIPSLKTMHENLKYLEVGAKVLKTLLVAKSPRLTIHNALRSAWTYNGEILVDNKDKKAFIKANHSDGSAWDIIYKQVWIFALRNFSELGGRAPRKENRLPSYQPIMDPVLQYELLKFAKDSGINTRKIDSTLESDPRHTHTQDKIESVTASFVKDPPIINSNDFFSPMDLSRRWGVPFAKNYATGKEDFYLYNLSKTSCAKDDMPNHLFILSDFISSFFGKTPHFEASQIDNSKKQRTYGLKAQINTVKSSSFSSIHEHDGRSSFSVAPRDQNIVQSTIFPKTSQSKNASPKEGSDFVFDSSTVSSGGPKNTTTEQNRFQIEWMNKGSNPEIDPEITSTINKELVGHLEQIKKSSDSHLGIQGTGIHEGGGDFMRKPSIIQTPKRNLPEGMEQENIKGKGKEIFDSKGLALATERFQRYRSPVISIASETSSSDTDSMIFKHRLTYGARNPNLDIGTITWKPEESPNSHLRSPGLPDVLPVASSLGQVVSPSYNQSVPQSDARSQGMKDVALLTLERARSPALTIALPSLSPNHKIDHQYQSLEKRPSQQTVIMQPKLQSSPPVEEHNHAAYLSRQQTSSIVSHTATIEQKAITDDEWRPETPQRSPIMSMVGTNTILWQDDVDSERLATVQPTVSTTRKEITINPQYMKHLTQDPSNRSEPLDLRSPVQLINYTTQQYKSLTKFANLNTSETSLLAKPQGDDQAMDYEPTNTLVLSSLSNRVPNMIDEDENMEDISSISLPMELPKEARRSIPIAATFSEEEDEPMEDPKPVKLSVSVEEEAIVQETSTVRLAIELPKEPRRSMPIPLPSEMTPTAIADAKSNNSDEDTSERTEEKNANKSIFTPSILLPDNKRALIVFNAPGREVTESPISESSNNSSIPFKLWIKINEFNGMRSQQRAFETMKDIEFYLNRRHDWALLIDTPSSRGWKTISTKHFLKHIKTRSTASDTYYCFQRQHYEKMKSQSRGKVFKHSGRKESSNAKSEDMKTKRHAFLDRRKDLDKIITKKEQPKDVKWVKTSQPSRTQIQSEENRDSEQPEGANSLKKKEKEKEEENILLQERKQDEIISEQTEHTESAFINSKQKTSSEPLETIPINSKEILKTEKFKPNYILEEKKESNEKEPTDEVKPTVIRSEEFDRSKLSEISDIVRNIKRKHSPDLDHIKNGIRKRELPESGISKMRRLSEGHKLATAPGIIKPRPSPIFLKRTTTKERSQALLSVNEVESGGPRGSPELFPVED
ncbi:uncharacterized protein EAF02_007315 [Botrytis sinoallii]|uniref:uncharacterized protein n=1 Tax=Botrytis sinoallii TaxID=1463999 RepID=UPI0018FF9496|nr:uncharacterized protein EAF02_007315 [Botrytis sinoallii]KAF7880469.1 hypothetical protein EAF02_007315 [Botrytis sinoallii]